MSAASLVAQGYHGYAGWSDKEADADFAATGGAGKGGPSSGGGGSSAPTAEEYADALLKAQEEQIKRETDFLQQYTKDNPFIFDEELARKSATAEYEPYYTELLQDYVSDLNVQRETTRGEANLLTTLRKLDSSARSRNRDLAVDRAREGFAGQGMFFSGIRQRGEGLANVDYVEGQRGATARYDTQEAGYQRQLGQYDVSQERKTRDVGREQQYAVEGGILQREKEAKTQYYVPLEQAFYRQFPSSGGSALKGYTIPEYYRF